MDTCSADDERSEDNGRARAVRDFSTSARRSAAEKVLLLNREARFVSDGDICSVPDGIDNIGSEDFIASLIVDRLSASQNVFPLGLVPGNVAWGSGSNWVEIDRICSLLLAFK